jgi:cyclophilin family peptidyl-prolyl cis-trans isomerase
LNSSYIIIYILVALAILAGLIYVLYSYAKKSKSNIVKTPIKADEEKKPELVLTKVLLTTNKGEILLELRQDLMPYTVSSFLRMVKSTFYNGLYFHRVEPFLIQSGDPASKGLPAPKWTLKLETNKQMEHKKYAVGMARAKGTDTANTQFYILKRDVKSFDGQFAVFGKVIKGFDVIEKIVKGDILVNAKEV